MNFSSMKNLATSTVIALICLFAFTAIGQNLSYDYYDGELWVQIDPTRTKGIVNTDDRLELAPFKALLGAEICERFGLNRVRKPFHFAIDPAISEVYQLFFDAEGDEDAFAAELEKLEVVRYAERIPVMRPTLTPNDLRPATGNPNQWGLHRIQAPLAWDITTGNTNIKVAVVDDAVLTTHPDLIPNLLPGRDVSSNTNNAMPNETGMTHGTHVAGIVSAATNNNVGIASIGFNVKIIPVKSSNSSQFISDAYAGVVWSYQNDADVINMSWGGSGYSQTGQNIINNAYAAGCVNVAAAGNDNVTTIFYPAGYNNVISVASTTTNDAKSNFSNYGNWIDISAPGSAIYSTYFTGNYNPGYANLQGTSMASPMVAGLCALVKSVNPQMTQTQITNCVLSTADNINGVNGNFIGQLGAGRINAYQAVLCAQTTINTPPVPVIQADNTVRCPGASVQFFGSSIAGLPNSYLWSFPGGNPSTSTLQNPVVTYTSIGNYNVSLTLTNAFGSNTETENNFVEISPSGTDVFFAETFENGTFADNGWTVQNPDNGITWAISTVAGSTNGTRAAGVNHFNYDQQGQRDGLISPPLDFSGHANIQLDLQHAHRRFSQDYRDSLIIYVSTNGGVSFPHRVLAVAEDGTGTFATNGILNQNFIPTNGIDWCFGGDLGSGCFTVDLSQFDGQPNVRLRFETYNDYGNNIYVDNVQLSGNCVLAQEPPGAGFSMSQTALCAGNSVQFTDQSTNLPTSYTWTFPGGTPSISSDPSPSVTYNTPGTYNVTLAVSNAYGQDQLVMNNAITVNASPVIVLNSATVQLCEGSAATLSASGANSYSWSPAIGLSSTTGASVSASPTASTTYTVTGTSNGCTAMAISTVTVSPVPPVPQLISGDDVGFVMLNTPAVQGSYPYALPGAGWGSPALTSLSVEAEMVIARSNSNDSLLCSAAFNADQVAGRIAVVYRGDCEFGNKALNAQNAGAVGVIVVNNVADPVTIEMGSGVGGASVTVPVVMVSQQVGATINAAVRSGNAKAVLGRFHGGDLSICPLQSLRLATQAGQYAYQWSNGDNSAVSIISTGGEHSVTVFNEGGCSSTSAVINVTVFDVTQPIITDNGSSLNANAPGSFYQWYIDGAPVENFHGPELPHQGPGNYTVEVTDANGCITQSEPYTMIAVGMADIEDTGIWAWPIPTTDILNINLPAASSAGVIDVMAADGRKVMTISVKANETSVRMDVSSLAAGTYIARFTGLTSNAMSRFVKM
jgi:serine protease